MNKNTKRGPGRPKYEPTIPNKRFTFTDFMEVNDVSLRTGKGPNCTKLTLTKFLDRDLWIRAEGRGGKKGKILRANPHSLVVRLPDVYAEPDSKSGLGRKGYVYLLRSKLDAKAAKATAKPAAPKASKPAKATRKARTPKTTAPVSQTPTADALEAIHKVLATPDPTPAPAAAPAPAVTMPVVAVTSAPAPVANETANAETATPATAPVAAEATATPETK